MSQLLLLEGEVRPATSAQPRGLSHAAWRSIEGRIDRLSRGELIASDGSPATIGESGARLDEVVAAVRLGRWKVAHGLTLDHGANYAESVIVAALALHGWTIEVRVGKRFAVPPTSGGPAA